MKDFKELKIEIPEGCFEGNCYDCRYAHFLAEVDSNFIMKQRCCDQKVSLEKRISICHIVTELCNA